MKQLLITQLDGGYVLQVPTFGSSTFLVAGQVVASPQDLIKQICETFGLDHFQVTIKPEQDFLTPYRELAAEDSEG